MSYQVGKGSAFAVIHEEGFYFRIFGYGLDFVSRRESPLFSERNGFRVPIVRFAGWRLFYLNPKNGIRRTA